MTGLLFAALVAALSQSGSGVPDTTVRLVGDTLEYRGQITAEGVQKARLLLQGAPDVSTFLVESKGGDIEAGIRLGETIHANELDVRVTGYCMSSCANYVFPAGRDKIIEPDALVIWHGSAIQEGLWEITDFSQYEASLGRPLGRIEAWRLKRHMRRYGARVQAQQRALYEKLGVDAEITVFGQREGSACMEWTFTVEDMAAFGIHDVQAARDYGRRPIRLRDVDWCLLARPHDDAGAGVRQRVEPGSARRGAFAS